MSWYKSSEYLPQPGRMVLGKTIGGLYSVFERKNDAWFSFRVEHSHFDTKVVYNGNFCFHEDEIPVEWKHIEEQKTENFSEEFQEIQNELLTQDNLATADPIYVVQMIEDVYGTDEQYTGKFAWVDVQWFFTRKAAQLYLDSNKHNLRHYGEPRIYVKSLYRNREMQTIRNWLMGEKFSE